MKLNVLGAEYTVTVKNYKDEEAFGRCSIDGYHDGNAKEIAICDMHTYPGWEHESEKAIEQSQKETLRHEITHAFLHESGLADSANQSPHSWAKNEEMVDWIAIQGPKIYKAWQEAGAL